MAVEVVMPKLGMSMKEGTVSVWNKEVGETVNKGKALQASTLKKLKWRSNHLQKEPYWI